MNADERGGPIVHSGVADDMLAGPPDGDELVPAVQTAASGSAAPLKSARLAGRWRSLWRKLWPLPWTDPRAPLFDPWHGRNPVFLHELYAMRFQVERRPGRRIGRVIQWIGLVLAVPVIVYAVVRLALEIARGPEPLETLLGIAALTHLVAAMTHYWQVPFMAGMLAASPAAASINRERDRGTWDLLRTTPLSARRIVLGKALAAAETFPLVIALLLVVALLRLASLALLMALAPARYPEFTPVTALILLVATLTGTFGAALGTIVGAAGGIAASAWIRWSAAANGLVNSALFAAYFVVPTVLLFVGLIGSRGRVFRGTGFSYDSSAILAAVLPLAMALVYSLLAAGLVRLAIAGVRRRE